MPKTNATGQVAVFTQQGTSGAPHTFFVEGPSGGEDFSLGAVHGFVPGTSRYVQSFELSAHGTGLQDFGSALAMFGNRIAVGAAVRLGDAEAQPPAQVLTFSRNGSTVQPLGTTGSDFGSFHGSFPISVAIANNVLLVGSPEESACRLFGVGCVGEANFFDLNRFEQ
jgi:hypothetical protein